MWVLRHINNSRDFIAKPGPKVAPIEWTELLSEAWTTNDREHADIMAEYITTHIYSVEPILTFGITEKTNVK